MREQNDLEFYRSLKVIVGMLVRDPDRLPPHGHYVSPVGDGAELFPITHDTIVEADSKLDQARFLSSTFNFNCFIEDILQSKGCTAHAGMTCGKKAALPYFVEQLSAVGVDAVTAASAVTDDPTLQKVFSRRGQPMQDPLREIHEFFAIRHCLVHAGGIADSTLLNRLQIHQTHFHDGRTIRIPYVMLERVNALTVHLAANIWNYC